MANQTSAQYVIGGHVGNVSLSVEKPIRVSDKSIPTPGNRDLIYLSILLSFVHLWVQYLKFARESHTKKRGIVQSATFFTPSAPYP